MATLECFENLIWLKITIRTNKLEYLYFKHFQSRDHKMTSLSIRSITLIIQTELQTLTKTQYDDYKTRSSTDISKEKY